MTQTLGNRLENRRYIHIVKLKTQHCRFICEIKDSTLPIYFFLNLLSICKKFSVFIVKLQFKAKFQTCWGR